jgi:hypothetical protein
MNSTNDESNYSGYSPNVLIYLEIDKKKIRLADVLNDSATLYEHANVPSNTLAQLVIVVDNQEKRQQVLLYEGISKNSNIIYFSYTNNTIIATPIVNDSPDRPH